MNLGSAGVQKGFPYRHSSNVSSLRLEQAT